MYFVPVCGCKVEGMKYKQALHWEEVKQAYLLPLWWFAFPSRMCLCYGACISFGCILDFPDSWPKGGVNDVVRTASRVILLLEHLSHGVFFSPYMQEYSFSDSSQQSCSSVLTAEDVTYLPYYNSFLQLHQCAELPAELSGELCLQTSFPPWTTRSG